MNFREFFIKEEISRVKRDNHSEYKYLENVLYKLGSMTLQMDVSEIKHTIENTFYADQIENYKEYIEDGGILETFPVEIILRESDKIDNLDKIMDFMQDTNNFDDMWLIFFKHTDWKTYDKLFDKIRDGNFNVKAKSIEDVNIESTEDEENDDIEDVLTDEEYSMLENIFDYFSDKTLFNEMEVYLTDFNHRFAAIKELGIKSVLVEPMDDKSVEAVNKYPELFYVIA